MQEDALLIRRAKQGDADAFEALMAPLEKRIYAIAFRMLGNREDAMDCGQEAMMRIWRGLSGYRREAAFATWCARITMNACLDMLRRKKVRPAVSLEMLTEAGFVPPAGEEVDPQTRAEASEKRRALERAILTLPAEQRAAFILRDLQGFSYEEVGQMLHVPLGTVKSRISRARERLRSDMARGAEQFAAMSVQGDDRRMTHEM